MNQVDRVVEKAVEEGGVLAILYFDLHGTDKETLLNLSTGLVQKILKEKGVIFARGEIDEPMENEGLFSTSLELKILVEDVLALGEICANFSPFSMEVLEPQEFKVQVPHMQDLFMFISTNSHDYKKYILEKLSPPDKAAEYAKSLHSRAELGRLLRERKE